MQYVIKIHIECDSPLDASQIELEFHRRLRHNPTPANSTIHIDGSETFVVATERADYLSQSCQSEIAD